MPHSTIDIFIPNKPRRSHVGCFLTTLAGLRADARNPVPTRPRVREHDAAIPPMRTPNQYKGAYVERYEEPCQCDACSAKRTGDAFEESKHPRNKQGEFGKGGGKTTKKKPVQSPEEKAASAAYLERMRNLPDDDGPQHAKVRSILDKLSEQYPLAGHVRVTYHNDSPDMLARAGGNSDYGLSITLNPDIVGDPAAIARYEKEWDGLTVGNHLEGVVTHEFGHALSHIVQDRLGSKRFWQIFKDVYGGDGKADLSDVTHPLNAPSAYGQENAFELMAESFNAQHYDKHVWGNPEFLKSEGADPVGKAKELWGRWIQEASAVKAKTKDDYPGSNFVHVLREVPPGTLPFEQVFENALDFPEVVRTPAEQWLPTQDDFKEGEHPRGQPGNKGEFAKGKGGGTEKQSVPRGQVSYQDLADFHTYIMSTYRPAEFKLVVKDSDGNKLNVSKNWRSTVLQSREVEFDALRTTVKSKGVGSSILRELASFADKHGIKLTLKTAVQGDFGGQTTSRERLIEFYGRFGFVLAKPLARSAGAAMKRLPVHDAVEILTLIRYPQPLTSDAFKETEHPRGQPENPGQFAEKAGGPKPKVSKAAALVPAKADRSDFPEHIKKLVLPPAWTNVHYNPDPLADLLAQGKDAKGRLQSVYSAEFAKQGAIAKFGRVAKLEKLFEDVTTKNETNRKSNLPIIRDTADVTKLIMETGIRPGSDEDTKAKVKAYGATTLLGQHVKADASGVTLDYIGKDGVHLTIPVTDKDTADMVRKRAKAAGPDGKLFPTTSSTKLQGYVKQLSSGEAKPKDFRTYVANSTALGAIRTLPVPENETAYKKSVREVAKRVSEKLGNTPVIALASYINPVVFAHWRAACCPNLE